MLHTHTRPEPGQPWKARGRKKADTRRADGQKQRRGGGEQTDLRNQPTRRDGPDPKQRTHLNPTTHYGEARTKWGTSWWQTKPKQVVKKQDSVPKPIDRAIVPQQARVQVSPEGIKRLSSSSELGAQHVSPHQKPKRPHLQEKDMPVAFICSCHVPGSKLKLQEKRSFWLFRTNALGRHAFRRETLGPPGQRDSSKTVDNSKAICCTLLKRITKLKCVNSDVRSVDINPTKEVASLGPMAPCRGHHRNHTRQEWIIIWSDRNWILKHANQPRSLDV